MLTVRIIPCLDVRDGRVVKGVRFKGLRDCGSPVELAVVYEAQGADELIVLDVAATPEKKAVSLETVAKIRERIATPLTVGGGVQKLEDAAALLKAGADKVAINTAAVRNPSLLTDMAEQFGSQCTVVAIDAARTTPTNWEVVICSGRQCTRIDAIDWARSAARLGAGEILLTSRDRDGSLDGYDLELIAEVSKAVSIPTIASGGAAQPLHLLEAIRSGANAVLAASIFHDNTYTVQDVKRYLARSNIRVRR